MKDQISISRVKALHPAVRQKFEDFVTECEETTGATLRIVQGLRTIEEQDALYAKGRTTPGPKVTNARGGSSYHNYGLAIDLVEIKDGKANWNFAYEKLKPIAKKYGLTWGGDFRSIVDKPHFEYSTGYPISALKGMIAAKKYIPGMKYVDLA